MDFFKMEIPEEVIENHILPKLNWNDLLRFRRVCKITKGITDRYLRLNPHLAPEVEINDDSHSFWYFLQTGIPSTRIFINNSSGYGFYAKDKKNKIEFLRQFGPLVKHLRLSQLSLYVFGDELDFLRALVNLETLEAGCFGFGLDLNSSTTGDDMKRAASVMIQLAEQDPRYLPDNPCVPDVFDNLKVVKMGPMPMSNIVYVSCMTMNNCKKLEYALLPFYSKMSRSTHLGEMKMLPSNTTRPQVFSSAIQFVSDYIQKRRKERGGQGNLKIYDFDNYHYELDLGIGELEAAGSPFFLRLCALCQDPKNEVKLMNVGASWFMRRSEFDDMYKAYDIATPVVSMVNIHAGVVPLAMPNLEKIDIRTTTRSFVGPHWRQERRDWPQLKTLHINVDSKQLTFMEAEVSSRGITPKLFKQETTILFQFFFQGIRRTALTYMSITFEKDIGSKNVPKAEEIVTSCPNLKNLTLKKWTGTNKALTKLWNGLPGLEEISLEYCKDLGNVAFVGEDQRNPVFFKLKNLRRLSLEGLDQMPKITDTLFSLVLRHMKLTHLILTSGAPVVSVTSTGILKLLDGKFAESIEKFPFSGWSLATLSAEEFKQLGKRFRSSDML